MSHPTLNIHKAFFEIGEAFRVTGVYGLILSLTHTPCLPRSPFLRSYWSLYSLGLFALYNGPLSARGLALLRGETEGEEKVESRERDKEKFCSGKTAALGLSFARSPL